LGIATEITFKLVPSNKHSKLVVIFMDNIEPLGRVVEEILAFSPETLEAYDDKTMKLAVNFFPDFLKNKRLFGMLKFMWSFLPEFFMMVSGGFPKLILLVEFTDSNEAEINQKCVKLQEKIKNFKLKIHITKSEIEANKYWDIRRESFTLLRKHVQGKRTAPFIDDIIVRPEFLPKFLPELNAVLRRYKLIYTLAGHAGRVFTRQMLLEALWGGFEYREPRTIDVHIRHLREKIERDPREPELIFTVRGVGYRFRDR
jgi:FAD/FMN-containing dehydrogenase